MLLPAGSQLAGSTLQDRLGRLTLKEGDLLLGGLFSFSAALQQSGLAQLAADALLVRLEGWPVYGALVAVYAVTLVGTELLSNGATVLLLLPVVAKLAKGLQQPPLMFIYVVVFAASQSFLSPIGYQTNLMVYSPGNYRFLDFLRFGWPLSLLYAVVIPLVILRTVPGTWQRRLTEFFPSGRQAVFVA